MSRPVAASRGLLCLLAALLSTAAYAAAIDPEASTIGFSLRTRWGQVLEGRFPRYEGEVASLPDGLHQVRLKMSARDVEIVGNQAYTRLTRGDGFFDAERFPLVEFVSDPYAAALTRDGGHLAGQLTIRGVRRREVFTVERADCDEPAVLCDVVARGSIDRADYGVDRWGFAVSSRVVFNLRVRTLPSE